MFMVLSSWRTHCDLVHLMNVERRQAAADPRRLGLWVRLYMLPMKTSKNNHYEPWDKRERDGDGTDWWMQQQSNGLASCIVLPVSVSVLQDIIKIKRIG